MQNIYSKRKTPNRNNKSTTLIDSFSHELFWYKKKHSFKLFLYHKSIYTLLSIIHCSRTKATRF